MCETKNGKKAKKNCENKRQKTAMRGKKELANSR
jgi:hypothetical protein